VREICTLRAMRQELETGPQEHCEPIEPSKELDWKPSPYSARTSSRPYWVIAQRDEDRIIPEHTSPHLHSEIWGEGRAVNPRGLLWER
jgi:hypothetical protein